MSTVSKLITAGVTAALAGAAFVAGQVWHSVQPPLLSTVFPAVPVGALLWLCLLLFLLLLALGGYLLSLLVAGDPRFYRMRFAFHKPSGFLIHRRTRDFYCTRCVLGGVDAPLGQVEKEQWVCMKCQTGYVDKTSQTAV